MSRNWRFLMTIRETEFPLLTWPSAVGRSIDGQRAEPEGESADLVFPADHSRSGRQDRSDVAQGLVGGGEQTMSRAWRHILNGQGAGSVRLYAGHLPGLGHRASGVNLRPTRPCIHRISGAITGCPLHVRPYG